MSNRNTNERDRLRQKRLDPDYLAHERQNNAHRMRCVRAERKAKGLPPSKPHVSLSLDPEIYQALRFAAAREGRSVPNMLRWLARMFVNRQGR